MGRASPLWRTRRPINQVGGGSSPGVDRGLHLGPALDATLALLGHQLDPRPQGSGLLPVVVPQSLQQDWGKETLVRPGGVMAWAGGC